MVARRDEVSLGFDPWAWLRPFDVYVWVMVLITIGVSAAVYIVLQRLDPTFSCKFLDDDNDTLRKFTLVPLALFLTVVPYLTYSV
jgi:hypothetical protein